jgi:hypothetical protein
MRVGAAMALVAALVVSATLVGGCRRGERFREFEYEEEIFLALDGSATVYVNSSVAALNALRGASFPADGSARIDREAVRAWFTTPIAPVTRRPGLSRRKGRRFVHVRIDIDNVMRLAEAAPFAWSSYRFANEGGVLVYRQNVGKSAAKDVGNVGWNGSEGVAFRFHMPSTVVDHNAGAKKRGNILVWEQLLSDRLRGEPMMIEARMETRSILSRTLLLFISTGAAVALSFGLVLSWVLRRGRSH